jgi:RHS repeat-associated protein
VPSRADDGVYEFATYGYDRSDAPLVSFVSSPSAGRTANQDIRIGRNTDYDVVSAAGFSAGTEEAASYTDTVDAAGRVTAHTNRFRFDSWPATYGYYPDGRMSFSTGVDGSTSTTTITTGAGGGISFAFTPGRHEFTYDARGQLATLKAFEGTYAFTYDEMGRNKRIDYPDGHARVQEFDELGRIKSRCYTYGGASEDHCYSADYDPVGNPVRLVDPDGEDVFEYDALDRLKKVTRNVGGSPIAVENYDYNALGALSVNQGAAVDHQRPRLDGGGLADAAVPNTLRGQPVALDGAGRVTSLVGQTIAWDFSGLLRSIGASTIDYDSYYRRIRTDGEYYIYEGQNRVASIGGPSASVPLGDIHSTFLYAGIDHPLRVAQIRIDTSNPSPNVTIEQRSPVLQGFYEIDLAGNVRRLRAPGGDDRGSARYSAFGQTLEQTINWTVSPLFWKGRWRDSYGGVEVYDMRARQWAPELAAFLSHDALALHHYQSTIWGWPGQNPGRWRDWTGRIFGDAQSSERVTTNYSGGAQSFNDPSFQTGYFWGGVAGAAIDVLGGAGLGALGVIDIGAAVTDASIEAWGALQEMGTFGRIVTALLGAPAGAELIHKEDPPVLPGQMTGPAKLAAQCVEKTLESNEHFGGEVIHSPFFNHVANKLPDGMVHDPTLRANLLTLGKSVSDIPSYQTIFTMEQWMSLNARAQ